jgi:hypothetical protein
LDARVLAFSMSDGEISRLTHSGKKEMLDLLQSRVGAAVQSGVPQTAEGFSGEVLGLFRWQSVQLVRTPEGGLAWIVAPGFAYGLSLEGRTLLQQWGVEHLGTSVGIARFLNGLPQATLGTLQPSAVLLLVLHPSQTLQVSAELVQEALKSILQRQWKGLLVLALAPPKVLEIRDETEGQSIRKGLQQVADATDSKAPLGTDEEGVRALGERSLGVVGNWSGRILSAALAGEGAKPQLIMLHIGANLGRDERAAYLEEVRGLVEQARESMRSDPGRIVQFMFVLDAKEGARLEGDERTIYETMRKELSIPEEMMQYRYGARSPEDAVEKYEQMGKNSLRWRNAPVTIWTMKTGLWNGGGSWSPALLKRLGGAKLVVMRQIALGLGQVELRFELSGAYAQQLYEEVKGSEGVEWDAASQKLVVPAKVSVTDLAEGAVVEGLFYALQQ